MRDPGNDVVSKRVPPTGSFSCKSNSFPYGRFERGLVLKQRHKVTRKRPIGRRNSFERNPFRLLLYLHGFLKLLAFSQ